MKLPLQLDEMRAQLEQAKVEAERVTSGLSEGQLWQPPPDGGWSVGECLAHLNTFGEGYALKLRPALQTQRRQGGGPFQLGLVGRLVVRSVAPDTKMRLKAPKAFQPEPQTGVVERFLSLQAELLELVRQAEGIDLNRVTISSPVSRLLRLSAFTALNVVTVHELRHLQQATQVRAKLESFAKGF